ncbi:MAG: DUF982 domain-containing protein [Actinomycetota bacterium]
MSTPDPIDHARAAVEAALEGRATVDEAREAFAGLKEFRMGMYTPEELDPLERIFQDAMDSLKLVLDALASDQRELARRYMQVAKIKLARARAEE